MTDPLETSNQVCLKPAVGVDEENEIGRVLAEMRDGPPHRITLANSFSVIADNDLGTRRRSDCRGIVSAIIGDDDQTVSGAKLQLDIFQRWNEAQALIMRRDNDCDALLDV